MDTPGKIDAISLCRALLFVLCFAIVYFLCQLWRTDSSVESPSLECSLRRIVLAAKGLIGAKDIFHWPAFSIIKPILL
jgi:hypothetical protein